MALNANLLSTKADCDKVLELLNSGQANLDYKRIGLERKIDNASKKASSIEADMASVQAEIDSLVTLIASLPEGATKQDMQTRKTKADFKLFTLGQRKLKSGTTAVVVYQSNLNEIMGRLSALAIDIAAVNTQKAALPS